MDYGGGITPHLGQRSEVVFKKFMLLRVFLAGSQSNYYESRPPYLLTPLTHRKYMYCMLSIFQSVDRCGNVVVCPRDCFTSIASYPSGHQ